MLMQLNAKWHTILFFAIVTSVEIVIILALYALGSWGLLDSKTIVSVMVSAVIPNIAVTSLMYYFLGEHRRNRINELLDLMEATQKLAHLTVIVCPPPTEHLVTPVSIWVENKKTQKVYRASKQIVGAAMNSGVIQVIGIDNEVKMKEIMKSKGFTIIERKLTLLELQ